ncbi:hypothetical protein FKW77_004666 [Venturia effusa]|uniref:Uncharacterized protein n=1 Tax=Venturia effusa TaxID=50376 RepID=A0A517LAV9_9PEZI|nr:hypothetical protein FKW77_004666 [Venturia effusa]
MTTSCINCHISPAHSTYTSHLCSFCANETHLAYEASETTSVAGHKDTLSPEEDKYAVALLASFGALTQEQAKESRMEALKQETNFQNQKRRPEMLDMMVLDKNKERQAS